MASANSRVFPGLKFLAAPVAAFFFLAPSLALAATPDAGLMAAIDALSTNSSPTYFTPSEGRLAPAACFAVIGTVTKVRADPHAFGTDIELQRTVWPSFAIAARADRNPEDVLVAFISKDNVARFSALDSYVGQQVALYMTNDKRFETISRPGQLQLLSTALADPKKTWCHLPAIERAP